MPAITGRARDIIQRADRADEMLISPLFDGAFKRTATDFRAIHGITTDEGSKGLYAVPEGTNVTYDAITRTPDSYSVVPYAVATGWTWEARQNDDLGTFLADVRELGRRATRNRNQVIYAAIKAALSQSTPSGAQPSGGTAAAGGPTIANIEWATTTLATDNRVFGAVTVPAKWLALATASASQQVVPSALTVQNRAGLRHQPRTRPGTGTPTPRTTGSRTKNIASWLGRRVGRVHPARACLQTPGHRRPRPGSFENMTEAAASWMPSPRKSLMRRRHRNQGRLIGGSVRHDRK